MVMKCAREAGEEIAQYLRSYEEHAHKIVREWGPTADRDAIRGWISDCHGFVRKAWEAGDGVLKGSAQSDFDQMMSKRVDWLTSVENQLEDIEREMRRRRSSER
jgi:hypothetical protein